MTNEYWDYHCHLIGYSRRAYRPDSTQTDASLPRDTIDNPVSTTVGVPLPTDSDITLCKRRQDTNFAVEELPERQILEGRTLAAARKNLKSELGHIVIEKPRQNVDVMIKMNGKLRADCFRLEASERELSDKAQKLRQELEEIEQLNSKLMNELKLSGACKEEDTTKKSFKTDGQIRRFSS